MYLDLDNLEHKKLQWASKERYSSSRIPRNLYVLSFLSAWSLHILPNLNTLQGSLGDPISLLLYKTPLLSRSTEIFEPFGRKIIYFVLETFTAILFALNQLASFCISTFTLSIRVASLDHGQSQVLQCCQQKVVLVDKFKSFMKHKNSIGPRILP